MRHEVWRAILTARGELDRRVASATGDYPDRAPPRAGLARPSPGGPHLVRATAAASAAPVAAAEHDMLHQLHEDVQAPIEVVRSALTAEPGGDKAMVALVLYFDERIMDQLPEFLATSWPLLQTRFTGRKTGGSDFFHVIDELLKAESQPALVFEVYYFCLSSGFLGQYADDLAALDRYKQRLRARIIAPEPQRQPREPVAAASPVPIKSPALYYAVAVAVVVVVGLALTVWSNQ